MSVVLRTAPVLHRGEVVHVGLPDAPARTIADVHRAGYGPGREWVVQYAGEPEPCFYGAAVRFWAEVAR